MLKAYVRIVDTILHLPEALHSDQRGQDAFEYLLVIGGISVAVVFAMVTPVGKTAIDAVVKGTCSAIATIPTMTGVSC